MKNDHKRLNLREIARLAGSSKSTVSRVLTKHPNVSPKTRARIEAVITKQQFRPNLFARGLAGGRTGLIAVLASEMNSGFFAEVIRGIDQIAQVHEGHVMSSFAHGTDDYVRLWSEFNESGRADGIIVIAPSLEVFDKIEAPKDIPTVLCACRPPKAADGWEKIDTVTINNRRGFHELMVHLEAQGCRSFVHIAGPSDMHDALERRGEVEAFIRSHPGFTCEFIEKLQSTEGGREAVQEYMKRTSKLPDAFVAVNDLAALGVLQALNEVGVKVPDAVAVTGCDDDPASAILGLTTLHMPMISIGRETAGLLFERLDKKRDPTVAKHQVVDLRLEIRATSRVPARR
jgi:LacI family transcriptional regulator